MRYELGIPTVPSVYDSTSLSSILAAIWNISDYVP